MQTPPIHRWFRKDTDTIHLLERTLTRDKQCSWVWMQSEAAVKLLSAPYQAPRYMLLDWIFDSPLRSNLLHRCHHTLSHWIGNVEHLSAIGLFPFISRMTPTTKRYTERQKEYRGE